MGVPWPLVRSAAQGTPGLTTAASIGEYGSPAGFPYRVIVR